MSVPILYEEDETEFINQGLGALSNAISCTVTEERNSSYELDMVYPVSGIHYNDLQISRIILAVPAEKADPQPFRIYKITKPIGGKVEVFAEHISYQLSFIPVEPFTASSCSAALEGLVNHSTEKNPFTVYTDISSNEKYTQYVPASFRSRLAGTEGSIVDVYGDGDFEFDRFQVKFLSNRGHDNGVVIEYGKNITDLKQEENIENTVTGIFPYWENNDYGKMHVVMLPEKIIETKYADNYPFHRTIPKSFADKFYEAPTEDQLREVANEYIKKNLIGVPEVSLDVSFVNLSDTEEYKDLMSEQINLCDIVTVYFPSLGVSAKAKVVTTVYDVLEDRYNSITVSSTNNKSNLAKTINDISKSLSDLPQTLASYTQAAVNYATNLINGGLGGHVVINYVNGYPSEILIMDTDSKDTAKNVIRMNYKGIGFSNNGYEGPFSTAWTIDSHFVADFITTGTLTAGLIKAGILSDVKGNSWWNMETGELHISTDTVVGDKDSTDKVATQDGVKQSIDVKAGEISTEINQKVDDSQKALQSRMDQTADSISLRVESKVSKSDYEASSKTMQDAINDKISKSELNVAENRITQNVTTQVGDQIKSATQWLDDKGVHVDTDGDTISRITGEGVSVFAKNSDGSEGQVLAKFINGESLIRDLQILGTIKMGAHRVYKMNDTEWDGTTDAGTGFMWTGGEG